MGEVEPEKKSCQDIRLRHICTYRLAETPYHQGEPGAGPEAEAKFKRIYEAHHRRVLAYCLRRSRSEGWDAAADTFAVAWRRIDVAPDDEGALPWLYTIGRKVLATPIGNARARAVASLPCLLPLSGGVAGVDQSAGAAGAPPGGEQPEDDGQSSESQEQERPSREAAPATFFVDGHEDD